MMGISAGLYEGIPVKDGQFTATSFHQYPIASLIDTPEIEVMLLESLDKPLCVGEPPIAPIAPAIANAVFDLTGQNIIIGLVTLAVFVIYLGLSGFYAIFALDGYYGSVAGLDFSSDVAASFGVFELGVLAMLYASVGGVFILALIKPEFWPDFHKYFIVSNVFTILGRGLIML